MRRRLPCFCLLLLLIVLSPLPGVPADEGQEFYFPVFLDRDYTGEHPSILATAPSFDIKVMSVDRTDAIRPLLVVIDPTSYSTAEMRVRIASLVAALAVESPKRPSTRIWLGIAANGGILVDPRLREGARPAEVVETIMRIMPESGAGQNSDPWSIVELLSVLLRKVQLEGGAGDCLLVAKDRQFPGEQAEYLRSSTERRALYLCSRTGTVLHGYLEGRGVFSSICAATGGMLFTGGENAGSVLRQVIAAGEQKYLVAAQAVAVGRACGRFALEVRAEETPGKRIKVRAPAALWRGPDDKEPSEHDLVMDALDWIRRAQATAGGGDPNASLLWIDNAVQLDPWNPEAYSLGARYASELRDYARAAEYISHAIRFVPLAEPLLVLCADIYGKTGRAAEALDAISSLPPQSVPDSPAARLAMARLLSSAGHTGESAALYRDLLGGGAADAQLRAEYGCVLWHQSNEEAAREQIGSALASDARNVTAMMCSAEIAAAHGSIREALALVTRAVQIEPEDAEAQVLLGKIRARAQQWESALESFQTAVQLTGRTDILTQLAEAELQSGQQQSALETMNKVLAANPADAGAWQGLAGIYARAGQAPNAAAILEQGAARVGEGASELLREAAAFRERAKQYGQAILDYRAAARSAKPESAAKLLGDYAPHLEYLSLAVKSVEEGNKAAGPEPSASQNPADGIIVPGGLSLLGNMLGISPKALRDSDAAGKVFALILESTQHQSELVQCYSRYEKLLRHMRKRRLLDPAYNRSKRQEFVFPLVGDKASTDKARKFLSFFGLKYSLVQKNGKSSLVFRSKQQSEYQERQRLLRWIGVEFENSQVQQIRFALGDEILPSIFSSRQLIDNILGAKKIKPDSLFARFVKRPAAMRLYEALGNCPRALRTALVGSFTSKELTAVSGMLRNFGRFLQFDGNLPILPGSPGAWEQLVGARITDPEAFLKAFVRYHNGLALCVYAALLPASPAVQEYFTESSTKLDGLFQLVGSKAAGDLGWDRNMARIIRLLSADKLGLFLPLDDRFGPYLIPGRKKMDQHTAAATFSPLRLTFQDLAALVPHLTGSKAPVRRADADSLELLKYIQERRPGMLDDRIIDLLMKDPAQSAVFLDLIWEINPPPDVLAEYLAYCSELARLGKTDWNPNRTRTSQAVFYLMNAFCRQRVLSQETAGPLLQAALVEFESGANEAEFLLKVTQFLTGALMPELARAKGLPTNSPDLLLQALAGVDQPQAFLFEGNPLTYDPAAAQLQLMKAAIKQQRIPQLAQLLDAIQLTQQILAPRSAPQEMLQALSDKLGKLTGPEPPDQVAGEKKQSAPIARTKQLAALLTAPSRGGNTAAISELMQQVVDALHTELGLALLLRCYAYQGTPHVAALAYDPDFVRKHEFYLREGVPVTAWVPAELEFSAERESIISGSLSGLGNQLNAAEVQMPSRTSDKHDVYRDWSEAVGSMFSGIRGAKPALRSDGAQEYVALTVQLGRELLFMKTLDPSSGRWSDPYLSVLLSQLRRERLALLLNNGRVVEAIGALSPSELFFLGEAYLVSIGVLPPAACDRLAPFMGSVWDGSSKDSLKPPRLTSPGIERLRQIIPTANSPSLDSFQMEVEQYGELLWRRLGILESSLRSVGMYEQVANYRSQLLFERVFDLKIRLAEIAYSAGLPASVAGVLGEMAVQSLIVTWASSSVSSWEDAIHQISRLSAGNTHGWMEELLGSGILTFHGTQGD